jgi:integrase
MMGRRRKALRFEDWPAPDQLAWDRACRPPDFLEPGGKAAGWADATSIQVIKGYGKWLGFLVMEGWLDPDLPPAARTTPARLEAYVAWMADAGLASTTIASRVTDLREAIRVMTPEADDGHLRTLIRTLRAREVPTRNKHMRILPPDQILEAALAWLDALPDLPCDNDLIRASWYRDALALAVLACRPIRRKNLTALTLGTNLVRAGGVWHCHFDASDPKERRPLSFAMPVDLNPYIGTYLAEHRPRLLHGNTSDRLWVSIRGGPASAQALYQGICVLTTKLFNRPINPHLLRDCVASAMIDQAPEHVMSAARILGHASIRMTMAYYDQSQMCAATEIFHETLADLKR